jgi:hypothetical protein
MDLFGGAWNHIAQLRNGLELNGLELHGGLR